MIRWITCWVVLSLGGCTGRALLDDGMGDDGDPGPPDGDPPGPPPLPPDDNPPSPDPPPPDDDPPQPPPDDDPPPDDPPDVPVPESGPWCESLPPDSIPDLDVEAPRVRVVAPPDGTEYREPAEFDVVGVATDDVCLSEVELFIHQVSTGDVFPVPLTGADLVIGVSGAPADVYEFWIEARDFHGNQGESNVVTVIVTES